VFFANTDDIAADAVNSSSCGIQVIKNFPKIDVLCEIRRGTRLKRACCGRIRRDSEIGSLDSTDGNPCSKDAWADFELMLEQRSPLLRENGGSHRKDAKKEEPPAMTKMQRKVGALVQNSIGIKIIAIMLLKN
jgi:hypothetical protein